VFLLYSCFILFFFSFFSLADEIKLLVVPYHTLFFSLFRIVVDFSTLTKVNNRIAVPVVVVASIVAVVLSLSAVE